MCTHTFVRSSFSYAGKSIISVEYNYRDIVIRTLTQILSTSLSCKSGVLMFGRSVAPITSGYSW